MSKGTGFVWNERYMWHDNGAALGQLPAGGAFQPGLHLENPETKRRLKNLLDAYGMTPQLIDLAHSAASQQTLERFHTREYIELVRATSETSGGSVGQACLAGPGSFDIARLAVGGTFAAVESVMLGQVGNAYALTRPPGHHAERDRGRGFCIFNNIGLAILEARAQNLVNRVAVVDWDVHHGNGTQQAFFDDPNVLTLSIHQEMLYPVNLGKIEETGDGPGDGFNINIPLPAGCGGGAYLKAMDAVIEPALRAFQPDLIIVACGFDAAYFDPLSHMLLVANHYRSLTKKIKSLADELCEGRLVLNHEGGYSDFYVPLCGMAVIEAITDIDSGVKDPYAGTEFVANQDLMPHQDISISKAIEGPLARLLNRVKTR
ncbi:MAG: class II histone deacetylase [Pseudomonadales bacterium]|jgi:acetoin utilization deacetylase AcuC-like enzyme|nr:class II histone deacetylase [Pseudomonadales bacterium]MDA0760566.1 class II histone deacetylase [Pseudomonadota bacterium]MDA0957658.1 class II histone deacetylase [Pseudomonadota bacterium]